MWIGKWNWYQDLYSQDNSTIYLTFKLYAFRFYLNIFEADTLAGESVLGSLSRDLIDIKIAQVS